MLIFESVSWSAAFIAGVLSFFSPCVLPLIPAYFSYISGLSIEDLAEGPTPETRKQVRIATAGFISGFTLVFIALGASATVIGRILPENTFWLRIAGGVLVMVFGLHLLGAIRIPFLEREKRVHFRHRPIHALAAVFIGMAFAAGWSPCIGPLLGTILVMAGAKETLGEGVVLLSLYSAGLAIPFIGLSLALEWLFGFIRKANRFLRPANITAGILLLVTGFLLITDKLGILAGL